MKTTFGQIAAAAAHVTGMGTASMAQEYPYPDIITAVAWGAGGGTDSINRMIMAEMGKHLPVSINVINQTGGSPAQTGWFTFKTKQMTGILWSACPNPT